VRDLRVLWRAWQLGRADARRARHNRDRADRCFYCGVVFAADGPHARTADHRVPRSRGGHDGLANLVFACRACNERKADTPEDEFVASEWLRRRRRQLGGGGDAGGGTGGCA
jgi:5-methylcytosine-specific restriction endonuclease McrA